MDFSAITQQIARPDILNRSGVTLVLVIIISTMAIISSRAVDREAERSILRAEAAKYEVVLQTEVQHLIDLLYRSSEWSFSPETPAIVNSFPWVRGIGMVSGTQSGGSQKESLLSLSLAEASRSLGGQVTFAVVDQSEIFLVLAKSDQEHTVRAVFSIEKLVEFMNNRVNEESLGIAINLTTRQSSVAEHEFSTTLQLGLPGLEFDVYVSPTDAGRISVNETTALALFLILSLWTIWLLLFFERRRRLQHLNHIKEQKDRIEAHASRTALAEVTSSLGHEINQPIAIIESLANTAAFCISKGDHKEAIGALEKLQAAAIRVGQIIQTIRRLSSTQNLQFEMIDLRTVIIEIEPFLKLVCKSSDLTLDIASRHQKIEVLADRTGIEQIITNLVTNAHEATANNPANESKRPKITLKLFATDEHAVVQVSDHGSGISQEIKETIFKAFVTTKSNGVGLGLNLSRSIAEKHHGWLDFVETGASGTTFELRLPHPTTRHKTK